MAVRVRLEAVGSRVRPGSIATVNAWVRNYGDVVEIYHLDVLGDPAPWAVLDPPSLSLLPGAEGRTTITFHVPGPERVPSGLDALGPAGADRDRSDEHRRRGGGSRGRGRNGRGLRAPARDVRARRRSGHRVVIENRGNTTADVTLTARDKDGVLELRMQTGYLSLPAGATREVGVRVRSQQRGRARHPFTINVSEPDGTITDLRGALYQRPPAKAIWVALLLGTAVLLAMLARGGPQVATSIRQSSDTIPPESLAGGTTTTTLPGTPGEPTTVRAGQRGNQPRTSRASHPSRCSQERRSAPPPPADQVGPEPARAQRPELASARPPSRSGQGPRHLRRQGCELQARS